MVKNIIKNEMCFLFLIIIQEIIRVSMNRSKDLGFSLTEIIIMVIIVAILSVIQQIIKRGNSRD